MGRSSDIVLYQAEWCPFCARVRSALTELLIDYRVVNVPREKEKREVVEMVSGQRGIPVMVDGKTVLDDDDEILSYLQKNYSGVAGDQPVR